VRERRREREKEREEREKEREDTDWRKDIIVGSFLKQPAYTCGTYHGKIIKNISLGGG